MRNLLALLFFCFIFFQGISQSFAYSFEGILSNTKQEEFILEIKKIQAFQSIELRYKSDSQRGEILFSIEKSDAIGENEIDFSPVQLKEIYLRFGLSPLDFRQLK